MKKSAVIVVILVFAVLAVSAILFQWIKKSSHALPASYYNIIQFAGSARPLSAEEQMNLIRTGNWTAYCPVPPYQLSMVTFSYWGFDGLPHINRGHLIILSSLSTDVLAIFKILYQHKFPISNQNTGGFDCRHISSNPTIFSEHAYGRAIDLDVPQNPISTMIHDPYLDRAQHHKGMLTENDIVVKTFKKYGWVWGGDWHKPKDYMHFEKSRPREKRYLKLKHQWPDLTRAIANY